MEVINKIQDLLISGNVEKAYEAIMQSEERYKNNAKYWNLKGMLCFNIQEYAAAITCYKTSIDIENDYLDAYFNIIYTYKIIGEKLKSVLYGGVSLRYSSDIEYKNDLNNLYSEEPLYNKYIEILEEVKFNRNIDHKNIDLINYISSQFEGIDKKYIDLLTENNIANSWAYIKNDYVVTSKEIISISDVISREEELNFNIIIPYDMNYINIARNIALKGANKCFIIVPTNNNKLELIEIDCATMNGLRNKDYERTVTLNKFNAADSNIHALIKYMPQKYKEKYKLNIINGRAVYDIENIIKVPIISSLTVSGFNTFTGYPKFTYNIDVGHAGIIMKNCGLMDRKYKEFSFTPEEYKQIDKVCVASHMSMFIQSAFSAISEEKFKITGNPRTDTLQLTDGRQNLQKVLGRNLEDIKIIFNMPTFHVHENSGVVNGEKFNEAIKIKNFDYEKFDRFLDENKMVCVSKVHHAEEKFITSRVKKLKLKNLLFLSNEDLDKHNLDLYEILNSGDLLITDYSSIYGDFLFMDKPIIFVNQDIEKYREERGLSLEPYDFWTSGPKVQNQKQLEEEIRMYLNDENYYKEKRKELRSVFFKYKDSESTLRVWKHIDEVLG